MTPEQIELARHALGLGNRRKMSYRNHYVADAGSPDHTEWMAMVDDGFARWRRGNEMTGGGDLFRLTRLGAEAALKKGERLDPKDFPQQT